MSQGEPPGDGDAMEQLRELIVGPERKDLADLRRIVTEPGEKAKELSRLLPQAVRLSTAKDTQLARALAPTLESALKESVKKDPRILTDVVFPIIGPAVRRAIADAFSKMLQSLNQTMENSLSVQGFKWRLEAKRTGKTFADVVMARTLKYRVERVFLIHKETGLLLAQAQAANASALDADMISGMLTAIQDFMQDVMGPDDGRYRTQHGDDWIWVESNSQLKLAALITGNAPEELRATFRAALEAISLDLHAELTEFAGDPARFEAARPVLEDCLREQRVEPSGKMSPLLRVMPLLLVLVLLGLGEWIYIRWVERGVRQERALVDQQQRHHAVHRELRAAQQRQREEEARLAACVQKLEAEEGIVVTEVVRRDGVVHLTGLRDPLAADPQPIIAGAGYSPEQFVTHWENYYALSPGLVLKRAVQRLSPPPGVTLAMRGETLVATGSATAKWVAAARLRADSTPGVAAFDTSGVLDETMAALAAKKKAIDEKVIFLGEGIDVPPEQAAAVQELAVQIADLRRAASEAGRRVRITVTGHTTEVGGEAFNLKLSRSRADRIVSALVLEGVDATMLVPVGVAAHERKYLAPEDEGKNRRVTFQAVFEEAAPNTAPQ